MRQWIVFFCGLLKDFYPKQHQNPTQDTQKFMVFSWILIQLASEFMEILDLITYITHGIFIQLDSEIIEWHLLALLGPGPVAATLPWRVTDL